MKEGKLKTPDWILEGCKSKEEWEKKKENSSKLGQVKGISSKKSEGKNYKIKICPECGSSEVSVILGGEEGKGSNGWECKACKWQGKNPDERELSEDEFLMHLEKMGGK